ncbi:MAG: pantoate--beta-alanine ligase [Myxococcales bacterium]|nr:pantoate--beta-alanine ligase [Myxococcales bacterium]
MKIIRTVRELQELADRERTMGRRIGLVPTMGALHAGHMELVRVAAEHAHAVWVSIFVNPTQFGPNEDLDAYPRTFEADCEACEAAGVEVIFAPEPSEMYPDGARTWVDVAELSEPLCGASRPGHFRGVATVVAKLFLAAKPHVAVFGEKDYQQLAVIRKMVRDLGFDLEIVGGPTTREADGLALSSRNRRLASLARRQARVVPEALAAAERAFASGERRSGALLELAIREIEKSPLAEIDYLELRHPESLQEVPEHIPKDALLALAVFFPAADGGARVRLIDNRVLRDGV